MMLPVFSDSTPTRREFCTQACRAASLLAAAGLAACAGAGPTGPTFNELSTVDGSLSNRTVSVTIDGSALASPGSAALVVTTLGPFLIARPAQDTFFALSAICTHQGCTITGFANNEFVCPCHGSQYTTDGTVVVGPAPTSLQQYPTHFDGTVLTFDV